MAKTIDLAAELEKLEAVNANDLIMGYSVSGKKFGFIPTSFITRGGYACRRWNMSVASLTRTTITSLLRVRPPSLTDLWVTTCGAGTRSGIMHGG